jgi:hypothetical protein
MTGDVPDTDIEGNPRPDPAASNPDMGAYESSLSEPSYAVFVWELVPGWNLVSTPVELLDDRLDIVLQSIDGLYTSVWAYDSASGVWKRYVVGGPAFLNDLETIEEGKGYWIYMTASATVILQGMPADGPVSLSTGWNLVGYNSLTAQSLEDAISSIAGNYNSVWTYYATEAAWKRYVIGGPEFLNNLGFMEPGRGYWIDAKVGCMLDVSGIAPPALSVGGGRIRISSGNMD